MCSKRKTEKAMHHLSLPHLPCGMAEKLWWVIPSRAGVRIAGMHCVARVHGWGSLGTTGTYAHGRWGGVRYCITLLESSSA